MSSKPPLTHRNGSIAKVISTLHSVLLVRTTDVKLLGCRSLIMCRGYRFTPPRIDFIICAPFFSSFDPLRHVVVDYVLCFLRSFIPDILGDRLLNPIPTLLGVPASRSQVLRIHVHPLHPLVNPCVSKSPILV